MQLTSVLLSLPLLAAAGPLVRRNPFTEPEPPSCYFLLDGGVPDYPVVDTDAAVENLLNNYAINAGPQVLVGNQLWKGTSGDTYVYVTNNSPCDQPVLTAADVHQFFDSIKNTCGTSGGASWWKRDDTPDHSVTVGLLKLEEVDEKYLIMGGRACTE